MPSLGRKLGRYLGSYIGSRPQGQPGGTQGVPLPTSDIVVPNLIATADRSSFSSRNATDDRTGLLWPTMSSLSLSAAQRTRVSFAGWFQRTETAAWPSGFLGVACAFGSAGQRAFGFFSNILATSPARALELRLSADGTNTVNAFTVPDLVGGRHWLLLGFSYNGDTGDKIIWIHDRPAAYADQGGFDALTGPLFASTADTSVNLRSLGTSGIDCELAGSGYWFGHALTVADFEAIYARGAQVDFRAAASVGPSLYIDATSNPPVNLGSLVASPTVVNGPLIRPGRNFVAPDPDYTDDSTIYARRTTISTGSEIDPPFSEYATNGYILTSSFIRKADGTLRLYYTRGPNHTDSEVYFQDSPDDGETWGMSGLDIYADGSASGGESASVFNPADYTSGQLRGVVVDALPGGRWLAKFQETGINDAGVTRKLWLHYSDDEGDTWTVAGNYGIGTEQNTAGTGKFVVRPDGSVLLPYFFQNAADAAHGIGILRSTDNGETWSHYSTPIDLNSTYGDFEPEEPFIDYLSSGELVLFFRRDDTQSIYRMESSDGGLTWTAPGDAPLVTPGYSAPSFIEVEDQYLIMGLRQPAPSLVFSKDKGVTWSTPVLCGRYPIDTSQGLSMYHELFRRQDGHVLHAFQQDTTDLSRGRFDVNIIRSTWLRGQLDAL